MRICLTSLILLAAIAGRASGAIDFTPTPSERKLDGVTFPQLIFHQDGHAITYEKPRDWNLTSDGATMRLTPPHAAQAQVTVAQTPLTAPQVFDDATTKELQQSALASVPPGAERIELVSTENNPLQIHGQPTCAVTVGYSFFGQDLEASTLVANLGDTQVRFHIVARKADFEQVQRQFRGSLFSLSWK
jgi:hypothetical protein